MKLDPHVHTSFSGSSTLRPFKHLLRESYNSLEGVYRRAKERGMDPIYDQMAAAHRAGAFAPVLEVT